MQQELFKELLEQNLILKDEKEDSVVKVAVLLAQINLLGTIKDLPTVVKAAKEHLEKQEKLVAQFKKEMED